MKLRHAFQLAVLLSFAPAAHAVTYYVNDSSTNGDVYCSSAGSSTNSGTNAASPGASLQQIIDAYALGGGDVVYVDTGNYTNQATTLTSSDQGVPGNFLTIQGSTNYLSGGSVFSRTNSSQDVLVLNAVKYVRLSSLTVRGGRYGIYFFNTPVSNELIQITSVSNVTGYALLGGLWNVFTRCVAARNGTGLATLGATQSAHMNNTWDQGVDWSNSVAFSTFNDTISVSNSVIVGGTAFSVMPDRADYNLFWDVSLGAGIQCISDLQQVKNHSFFSTVAEPLFCNPSGFDFHPRSITGTYSNGSWVTFTNHSPCIDLGDPTRNYSLEPAPRGEAINVGPYGNSYEASNSRTNPWLFAITFNDGGNLAGTGKLCWTYGAFTNGSKVKIQYSSDGSATWTNIISGLAVTNRSFNWVATNSSPSLQAYWRVVSESDSNVFDANDRAFVMRAYPSNYFSLYVNNLDTNRDVYCTQVGSATNTGLSSNSPVLSVQDVLDRYDLGPGDTIFVDTGVYTDRVVITSLDQGDSTGFMTIRGSVNGSTLLQTNAATDSIEFRGGGDCVRIEELILLGGRYGVYINSASQPIGSNSFVHITCVSNQTGFALYGGRYNSFTRCAVVKAGVGFATLGSTPSSHIGNRWEYGIHWSNSTAFSILSGALTVSNSVIVGGTVFGGVSAQPAYGDYNILWNAIPGLGYLSLIEMQKDKSNWWHSAAADPLFADASRLDFHPKSIVGTYSNGNWVVYTNHSPCIDLGDPSAAYANEPSPNGSNVNVGIHGNTGEASMSRTNAWLQVLSYGDGGVLNVPGDNLYWRAGNCPAGSKVRIEYSGDSGASWLTVATNLAASVGLYTWANTNFSSSWFGRWRVVYESDTNIYSQSVSDFTLRAGPYAFFVNDNSKNGDVYTTVIGNNGNLGVTSNTPKASLQAILNDYNVEPGDTIYIDTGYYSVGTISITAFDTGSNGTPVVIQGSTNYLFGGTVFGSSGSPLMDFNPVNGTPQDVTIRDLVLQGGWKDVAVRGATRIRFERVTTKLGNDVGFDLLNSSNITLSRCVSRNQPYGVALQNTAPVFIDSSLFWRNSNAAVQVVSGCAYVSNSILVASDDNAYIYVAPAVTNIAGDYNDLRVEGNAVVGYVSSLGRNLDTLSAWSAVSTQETHSLSVDPMFADADAEDYHLKTQTRQGRFDPARGWVNDDETSLLIDSGDPLASCSNEPAGTRVNIGIHGNTAEASKGRTNFWLSAVSHQAGGWTKGTSVLHWVAGNPTGGTVRVEVSTDGGNHWAVLTNGVPVTNEAVAWNTTTTNNTPAALWGVFSTSDTNVFDRTTSFVGIRNGSSLDIFINDGSVTGDVYCASAGAPTNWVASSNEPIDSLATAISMYDIEPGDRVFVDTGIYTNIPTNIEIGRSDGGVSGAVAQVLGSTNDFAGGSLFDRQATGVRSYGLRLNSVRWICLSNLMLRGADTGVHLTNSANVVLSVRSLSNASNGFEVISSAGISLNRCVAADNARAGVYCKASTGVRVLNSVIWSNLAGAIYLDGGSMGVSNSVVTAAGAEHFVYEIAQTNDILVSDYNDARVMEQAWFSKKRNTVHKYLSSWQEATTNDTQSLSHDPLFANPATGDFHLKSQAGRYQPGVGIVTDTVNSLLIDAGDPAAGFSAEPLPNGGRLNIGLYGDTAQESRSRTNGWLVALTLNSGGLIRGTNYIYWMAGGAATGMYVYVDYSPDGGSNWVNIATNRLASENRVLWNTLAFEGSALGQWRVTSQSDPTVWDVTDSYFALKNEPLGYYVNDASTNGDVYTTEPGSDANDGLRPSTPKASIQNILNSYILEQGDQILVDTGTYNLTNSLTINNSLSGAATNLLVIRGSTNEAAGGTLLNRQGGLWAIEIQGTKGIGLLDLRITNAVNGVSVYQSTNCTLDRVRVDSPQTGFEIRESPTNTILRSVVSMCWTGVMSRLSSGTKWDSGVIAMRGMTGSCVDVVGGNITVSNSLFSVDGNDARAYHIRDAGLLTADYNALHLTNGALVAIQSRSVLYIPGLSDTVYDNVSRWARDTGRDRHTLSCNPGVADLLAGDFHLLSQGGRYVVSNGTFVLDEETSALIDAGDPAAVFTNEPTPNGGRVNIGLHGNTTTASKTPTNGFFTIVSLNDGGRAEGMNWTLYWVAHGDVTGHLVRLEFSADAGVSWQPIASNLSAASGAYPWNTTLFTNTLRGMWKITSQSDTSATAGSGQLFAVRNAPFSFYVNDGSTNGDVYTSEIGNSTNTGLIRSAPKASLQQILDAYDLEGGDTIYVDTGSYSSTVDTVIGQLDAGDGVSRLVVQGSTNEAAGGTVFSGFGIQAVDTRGIELRHLRMRPTTSINTDTGVELLRATNSVVEWVRVEGGNCGFSVRDSQMSQFRHCLAFDARSNGFESVQGSLGTEWSSSVLWSNGIGVYIQGGSATVSNSVIAEFGATHYGFSVNGATLASDYNNIFVANGAYLACEWARLGRLAPVPSYYVSLSAWTYNTGRDQHSLSCDPAFIDPAGRDFHLLSREGRFVVSNGLWVTDGGTSPLVDAGDPSSPYGSEPSPNGSRVNIGLYGNTSQASKTPTNASLTFLSLSDGGRAEGTNFLLHWIARGDATGQLLRIDFSPDAGTTWQVVTSNLSAFVGVYPWDTTLFPSTVRGVLSITSQNDSNISDRTRSLFAIRNSPMSFYVNDSSTNGDVYTQSVGVSTNLGLTAGEPMVSLQMVLSTYDIEDGDVVYVDTGIYTNTAEVFVGQWDSAGSTGAVPVTIQGSTNYAAGGTVLDRAGGAYGIRLSEALGVTLRNLIIRNASVGVNLYGSPGVECERIEVQGGARGFDLDTMDWGCVFRHCLARNTVGEGFHARRASDVQWLGGILWSNSLAGMRLEGAQATVRDSVIGAFGQNRYAFYLREGSVKSDYNDIFLTNGACAGYREMSPVPLIYQNVSRWVRDTTQDVHSLSHDPGFFSPGTGDFHLKSQEGRYVVTSRTFVADAVSSVLIDAGDPLAVYTNETLPNGARLNIGLFGNTAEASRSHTNASLTAVSLNDGGRVEGSGKLLYWIARGDATGHAVSVEFSPDAGLTWQVIATNLPVGTRTYSWNTMSYPSTMLGLWRVISEKNTNVSDVSDSLFAVRNDPLAFYVNDAFTNGDVYTSALGNPTNTGADASVPKDSLQAILDAWDLEPGDTIYVDTGEYVLDPITLGQFDSGARSSNSTFHVVVQGSTNDGAGGSVFAYPFGGNGIVLDGVNGVDLKNLTIRNASVGVLAQRAYYGLLEYVRCERGSIGFSLVDSAYFIFRHCVAWGNTDLGLSSVADRPPNGVLWDSGVLWSNFYGVYVDHGGEGEFTIRNSNIGVFDEGGYAYFLVKAGWTSDYNNLYLRGGAFAGAVINGGYLGGGTSRYESVASWLAARGQDVHTMSFEPGFADANMGDFHLKSVIGRYLPGLGWTNDPHSSFVIDGGNPQSVWTNEPWPNGGRVNIDLYGNTWQASKTPTNGWLVPITLNDGGSVQGTNILLRWFAGWVATGHVLRLEYSGDAGVTWTNIISNSPPGVTTYTWDSVPYGRSAISKWRISSVDDPSISTTNDGLFVLRNNGAIPYYVNDASKDGDVYTRAVGSAENLGLFPDAPKDSIQGILDTYKLEPRDTIYVDTGRYELDKTITIDDLDTGSVTGYVVFIDGSSNLAHVVIQGSTNYADGGTVLVAPSEVKDGIALVGSSGIELRDLFVCNGWVGVSLLQTEACLLEHVQSHGNTVGFSVELSSGAKFLHSSAFMNTSNGLYSMKADLSWENGVIWNNPYPTVLDEDSVSEFRNSAIKASGSGKRIYQLHREAVVTNTDYNNLVRENGALTAERQTLIGGNDIYDAVLNWQNAGRQDVHSLSHDPFFADEIAGDFHPRSQQGRWVAGAGYTNDFDHSPLIDAGDPSSSFTNEPTPNGGRVNIGQYGNTTESSLSQTNPWVVAVSFNDRPTVSGTNYLRWIYGGMTSGASFRLEVKYQDSDSYSVLASNVPMSSSTGFAWDVSAIPLAPHCSWRVISESYSNVEDEVDSTFPIKNKILTIYVNDSSTNGDVYCTAIGSPLNTGTNASSPLDEPAVALYKYPIGRGDTIYIDTGVYAITSEVGLVINESSRGEELFPITIHGSTNRLAGGTVIDRSNTNGIGLLIDSTRFVDVDHLSFRGGSVGVRVNNSLNCSFVDVKAVGNSNDGFVVTSVVPVSFDRCSAWNNGGWGITVDGARTDMAWTHGVVWSNTLGGIQLGVGILSVSNSIIHAPSNSYLYTVSRGTIHADFNVFWKEYTTKLMRDYYHQVDFSNIKEWQENMGVDEHSVMVDPLFVNPGNGDFHLRSQAGRYSAGSFVSDAVTSWAIDAGDFDADFGNEPLPNGNRLNVGLEGNTLEASKSYTNNPTLFAVSLNDGGTVSGSQILYWLSRGMSPTNRVRIDYLPYDGAGWKNIATDLSATQQGYLWSNTNPPSPVARWRVMDQADTNVFDVTDRTFILRVGPIFYYVNDASTNGDIYTTVPGSPTNNGLFTNKPQSSIQYILDNYDLGPSDVIFVDTGIYNLTDGITVGAFDGGVATSRVSVVGSTNLAFGGTVLRMSALGATALKLFTVDGVALHQLIIENADIGVYLERARFCLGRNLLIRDGGQSGIRGDAGYGNEFERTVVTRFAGSGISLNNGSAALQECVIWSNRGHASSLLGSYLVVSNSVLHASGLTNVFYYVNTNSAIVANYNDLYAENEANIAMHYRYGLIERLAEWTGMTTQDANSVTFEPLFADPSNDDYHLRSATGRYDPGTRTFVTTDTNTSWLIDTGGPDMVYTNEPLPNGSRLNIGLYGNTPEASKSRTNEWLLAITGSGGGRLEGFTYLTWAWGSIDSTNKVSLDYSYDNGTNWMSIATNQAIVNGRYLWNSAAKVSGNEKYPSSPIARWRLVLESDTNLFDVTDSYFALRNKPFIYYVNDTNVSLSCDVYTTAPGDDSNLGIFSNAPKATLASLLKTLDVEGGDVILIDAGVYPSTNIMGTTITTSDQGKPGDPVIIRGNTNCTGSVFDRASYGSPSLVLAVHASYMSLRDLSVLGGHVDVLGQQVGITNILVTNGNLVVNGGGLAIAKAKVYNGAALISGMNMAIDQASILRGTLTIGGSNVLLQNSVIYNTNNSSALRVSAGDVTIRNNTIVSRGTAFGQDGLGSSSTLSNNILVADAGLGGDAFCIQMNGGILHSDYNDLVARNGAWIGNGDGYWERLLYWQRASGRDAHSLSHEPLFANEAGLDFHLKSEAGRYLNGVWTNDATNSPAIDAGDPLASFVSEPTPNGGRVNIGAYGNTPQASKSRTNAWLLAMTMNDGGVLKGTNNVLRWNSGNLGASDLVRLEYSPDGGATWTNIATGLSALAYEYAWDTTTVTSSLRALWRIVLQTNTLVVDHVDNLFAVRNTPLNFYVNDTWTTNDVYTAASGLIGNDGLTTNTPKNSIQGILTAYDVEARDTIYVDTGNYMVTSNVRVIWSHGGDEDYGRLVIQGSTNADVGGSIITRGGAGGDGFDIPASYVTLRDFTVEHANRGILFESNRYISAERIFVRSNQYGIVHNATRNSTNRNLRLWNNTMGGMDIANAGTTVVENCDFVINSNFSYRVQSSVNNILQNNIFYVRGTNSAALAGDLFVLDQAFIDYNIYYFETPSAYGIYGSSRDLMAWQLAYSNDFRSAITNPLFANVTAGDFHLKSPSGRYLDGYGWTNDSQTSWGINKGNPASPYDLEPATNGNRINIGAYGNTKYASRSSTNFDVYCRVLNSSQFIGEANSVWPLIWTAVNVPPSETFKVQYSGDGGSNWVNLATGINSYNEYFLWQTAPYYNTFKGRWRVVGESNSNYWDMSDANFSMFYGEFKIYSETRPYGLSQITWRGAWDETYQVQYATNYVLTTNGYVWVNATDGTGSIQKAYFRSTFGGDLTYQDPESTNQKYRVYRATWWR